MTKYKFDKKIVVKSYGVVCVVRTNAPDALRSIRSVLRRYLPGCGFLRSDASARHEFFYSWNASGLDSLYGATEPAARRGRRDSLLASLGSRVRITVAEYAPERVFIHAGVVGWKGRAIVIPARSFKGKTSLTAALVRCGALYYSDEYAILDKRGRVHPFPKELSLRGVMNELEQVDHPVETLGGKAGKRPLPVGLVVVSEYKKRAKWKPEIQNSAGGILEMINNTVSIRRDPKFVLPILSNVASNALIVKSKRGEAETTAPLILSLLERHFRNS